MYITKKEIENAIRDGNDKDNESFAYYILCEMCKRNPHHTKYGVVRDKILMIGRTYAAALERRLNKERKSNKKEESIVDFYERAFEKIREYDIDKWFESLKKFKKIDNKSIHDILRVHSNLVELFYKITQMKKRSLASKYLHFHFPNLFYLYDSRAKKGFGRIMPGYRTNREMTGKYDNEYENFALKLLDLQKKIEKERKTTLTPHQLDILLLRKSRN